MHTVAILGAGDLGGALSRTLATGDAVSRILLIDTARNVAAGKALDVRQAGPIESFDTALEGSDNLDDARGADVVVLADEHGGGEWRGDAALQLLARIAGIAKDALIVCAGAGQHDVIGKAVLELRIPPARLVGSAPIAAVAAARALIAPALDASPADVAVPVLGVPPAWVIAWSQATVGGGPADGVSPAAMARAERLVAASWPPGAYGLASAATAVIRAALTSSRRRFCCFTATPLVGSRPVVTAAPVTLGPTGIASVRMPALTPRERVALESSLAL